MTRTEEEPRMAGHSLTRQLKIGRAPDPDAAARYDAEAAAIRERLDARRISRARAQQELDAAAARRDRDTRDTRATYTITCTGVGPWKVHTPDGETLPGEWPQAEYNAATAAARTHHSQAFGSGLARAGQYVRVDVAVNRTTGAHLQLLDLEHPDSEYEPSQGRYAVRCVDHDTLAHLGGYAATRRLLYAPQEWCPPCKAKLAAGLPE